MPQIRTITIGLPARNEERTITKSMESLRDAMHYSGRENMRLVVCINGCTDQTLSKAELFRAQYADITCDIIMGTEGLVNAQRMIVEKYPADVYIFPDADNVIDKKAIALLLTEMEQHPEVIVAYGRTISLENTENRSLFYKMGLLYDSQKLLTPRHYFHGRLFATKDWFIPKEEDILVRATKNPYCRELLRYSQPHILLYADDVFMSSYIIDRYGRGAIRQVDDAHCYSWTVGSFRDWLYVYRRRNIEMEKMYRWFPEYNYLWPLLNRKTDWQKWQKAPISSKCLWLIFRVMQTYFLLYLKTELFLIKFHWFHPGSQWQVTQTTKNEVSK